MPHKDNNNSNEPRLQQNYLNINFQKYAGHTSTENHAQHIGEDLNFGFWIKNFFNGKIEYVSESAASILQYSLDQIYNIPWLWEKSIFYDDKNDILKKQDKLNQGEILEHQYRIKNGNDDVKWIYDQTHPLFNQKGELTHLTGIIADITSAVAKEKNLEFLHTHDFLTSLPKQKILYDEIDQLCNSGTDDQHALLFIDLDRFQFINDALGYEAGNNILSQIAHRLDSILPHNVFLVRGDSRDFIALVKQTTRINVSELSEYIMNTIERPLKAEGSELTLHMTASIGIGFYPKDGQDRLSLVQNAHAALLRAKQLGKNNYQFYTASEDIPSLRKLNLERDMQKAVANDEFILHYQPQVDTRTGVIQSAEALIRWNHPERGMVSPGIFMPLAEENHLIHPIGKWVIQTAIRQLREWLDNGLAICPIAVNVSPIQFMRSGLVEFIQEQLERYNVPANYLKLEITEGSVIKDEENILILLRQLKDLGIQIAIDDFGTGFSSLMYLKKFSPDIIKIDKAFIQSIVDIPTNEAAITSSVLYLAKTLDLMIVGEGVEEHVQWDFLKNGDCDLIQGFLFSKPVSASSLTSMLAKGYIQPAKPNSI